VAPGVTGWLEARRLAHGAAPVLPRELVGLREAAGRVLAADLVALSPLPSFDAAAMDGWAVRGPGPWTLVGTVLAGDAVFGPLSPGEAVEIATGAVLPAGSEGVIPYEVGPLEVARHPCGRHIRRRGEECEHGEVLLKAGDVLSAAALGLAASVGVDELTVRRVPRVVCVVTGSELLQEGLPRNGRIRDAVGPLLVPALRAYGAQVTSMLHLPDDAAALSAALRAVDADLVVTSGASSAGPADHLLAVLAGLRAEVLVDGVAVKPGHPQVLARLPDGPLVVGLPGNPLAAIAGLVTLVQPVLAGLLGQQVPDLGSAVLAEDVAGVPGSHRLVPVLLRQGTAAPTGHGGAAMLRGAALADAFAVLGPGASGRAGERIALVRLPG
jgi:molybdopterin molybdotransferase